MPFGRLSIWIYSLLLFFCVAPICRAAQATTQPAPEPTPTTSTEPADRGDRQAYQLPPDKLAKAIALNRIRNVLDIVAGLWGIGVVWLLLATGTAARLEGWLGRGSSKRWVQGLQFFAVVLILITLGNLPVDAYGHHVATSYGISVQGWAGWLWDQGKALGLMVGLLPGLLLLFNWIVRRWPRRYWFGIWLALMPLMVLSLLVGPLFEPIFNKYEPLSLHHAALVEKLDQVVQRTGTNIPPERMFLMMASAKSTGLNAYVNGIGATKRIVVWDTTADQVPSDEVQFIFGHESGHYVLNHIPKMSAIMAVGAFFVCWICAGFAGWMARRFGRSWGLGTPGEDGSALLGTRTGFVVLILAITIAGFVLEPATNTMSRYFEHQADVYGQEAIHGIVPDPQKTAVAAFNDLGVAWLEDPDPSPIVEFWEYNHPSVKNRANFAAHYDPWANGGRGEFFAK
jgi:STE24 endopeptidase